MSEDAGTSGPRVESNGSGPEPFALGLPLAAVQSTLKPEAYFSPEYSPSTRSETSTYSSNSSLSIVEPPLESSFAQINYSIACETMSVRRLSRGSGDVAKSFSFPRVHYTDPANSPSARYTSEPLPEGSVPQAAFTRMRLVPAAYSPSSKENRCGAQEKLHESARSSDSRRLCDSRRFCDSRRLCFFLDKTGTM